MRIVGYCVHGNRQYVAFSDNENFMDQFKITDGFHDRTVNKKNARKYENYKWVDQQEIDLKRIISRMRGARSWHPLLKLFKEEGVA